MSFDVVIPSAGRESLGRLLGALDRAAPAAARVIVVDDRERVDGPLAVPDGVEVIHAHGRGPAGARNVGWRAASAGWVAFLDDDVVPQPRWCDMLARDLGTVDGSVAGSQGLIVVPLPADRRPTDWERNVAGLGAARWATADMAYRRAALHAVGGFDERFRRAYREDADLALRLMDAGFELRRGRRHVVHPVGPASRWVSLRRQAGNADDALMEQLHGRGWRERAGAPRGRLRRHLVASAAGAAAVAVGGAGVRGRSRRGRLVHGALVAVWGGLTGELAWARIAAGPRTLDEVATMLATSALMPFVATAHRARGGVQARLDDGGRAPVPDPSVLPPLAILLDRDGTLIEDVPYNGDPERVRPLPGAAAGLARARAAGVKLAVVSNQSGIGRGLIDPGAVALVNQQVERQLGPLGPWLICPHAPEAGCACRKPAPGLVLEAARRLGVPPWRCAMIGDIGADVQAARTAGARGVLVPTAQTRPEEIAAASEVAASFGEAVDRLLGVQPAVEPGLVAA